MKSLARDGDNDMGALGSIGTRSLVLMTPTLRPATDNRTHTIDPGPRRTA
ncbi:hypothetical protein GCM10010497_34870 [Streptomyces cinereoruber]|uniref:Uncharacterized protein n=1 Tax=Streptomyces cinereoruber TaxID=67260 RepID=A0AAV4KJB4_9ACTN|nr:hypothetical protein GCM10010497_34870 [Streptomyces cinereoruber]